jgi:mutator protein MutT
MSNLKEVATIVVLEGEKFLILQRSTTSRGAGFWNFPGGSVEDDETEDLASVRELKEEADLDVNVEDIEFLGTLETSRLRIHFFITEVYSGTVTINKESDDFKWITMEELKDYLFVGGGSIHPDLIESIESYIK